MTGKLYFEDACYNKELVAENITQENVFAHITQFIASVNPSYKIHYMRAWEENGVTRYDVGSHSEFFIFIPEGVELNV